MPLIFDTDIMNEIKAEAKEQRKKDVRSMWNATIWAAVYLVIIIMVLYYLKAPTGVMVSVTIAAATLCVNLMLQGTLLAIHTNVFLVAMFIEKFAEARTGPTPK